MPTLAALESAATEARITFETARDHLLALEQEASTAIREHAEIRIRVLTGAGDETDVKRAEAAMDEAVKILLEDPTTRGDIKAGDAEPAPAEPTP